MSRKLSPRNLTVVAFLLAALLLVPTAAQATSSSPPVTGSGGTGTDAGTAGHGDEGAILDPHG